MNGKTQNRHFLYHCALSKISSDLQVGHLIGLNWELRRIFQCEMWASQLGHLDLPVFSIYFPKSNVSREPRAVARWLHDFVRPAFLISELGS
jgi:hypothetical protein